VKHQREVTARSALEFKGFEALACAHLHLQYGAGSLWGVVRLGVAGLGKEKKIE